MNQKLLINTLIILFLALPMAKAVTASPGNDPVTDSTEVSNKDKLVVVWTSGEKEVAVKYTGVDLANFIKERQVITF